MASFTTRMGLTKPAGTEDRSVTPLNGNADLLDKFMPCILVNDGVTPPTGDLYDGALVKERTSGIIWEARKNGGGTYDKIYVRYPFYIRMEEGTFLEGSGTSVVFSNPTFASGVNSSAANVSSGQLVIPVKGLYVIRFMLVWANNANGARLCTAKINGSIPAGFDYYDVIAAFGSGATTHHAQFVMEAQYNAGDTIGIGGWQNSGGAINRNLASIRAMLLEPLA